MFYTIVQQEEGFDRFSHWGDLSSVAIGTDENILAIPQHRIHYFKYRDEKIWDRDSRVDQVFGSTQASSDSCPLDRILEEIDLRCDKKPTTLPLYFITDTAKIYITWQKVYW